MNITEISVGDVTIATMAGRMDAGSASAVEEKVLGLLTAGTKLLVDLAEVVYVSSAGLRVLLLAAKKASAVGSSLVLAAPQAGVIEVLEITGFSKILKVYPTRELAAIALQEGG